MKRHVFCCSSFSDFSFCQPDGHQSKINHWGCKYETDHNWELLFRTLQWWYFGKYKYISNKGELKGNHRGSRSPFQIQGLGDTEITGGWTLVQSLVENSQDRFTAREKFEYVDYVFHELSRKSKRMWRAASKNIFWSSGDDMPTQKNLQHKYVPQIDSKLCWIMVVRIDQYNSVHHDSLIFSIIQSAPDDGQE